MEDKRRIIRAIRIGYLDEVIQKTFKITARSLNTIKMEFGAMREAKENGKTAEEAAEMLGQPLDVVKYAYYVLEADPERLKEEARLELERGEDIGMVETAPLPTPGPQKTEGRKDKRVHLKKENIEEHLTHAAETPTAELLMEKAGKAGRDIAVTGQALGDFVIETIGPMAIRLGYDYRDFLEYIYRFWLDNYLAIQEKDAEISDLREANRQLQDALDEDILRLYVARSMDRILTAALLGGGSLDLDALMAYKKMLETDIDIRFLKEKAGAM